MIKISEDKFTNKSVEEIIGDMLRQHKNNSKDALEHIQDILKDDGLLLNKNVKANLEKAVNVLKDKGLKEGWFSDPVKKYQVNFEVYLPFKKEPVQFQIPPVASLNDPLVKAAIAKIRKRHPKSTIYIRSELGNKRITETCFKNSNKDYVINLYTETGICKCGVGNLPIAMALIEKTDTSYKKAEILHENKPICAYDKVLKEWSTFKTNTELNEDIHDDTDTTAHSYIDFKNSDINLDERAKLIQCHLNPNLIDKRKPKWHNIFGRKEYVEIPGLYQKEKNEVLVVLDSIDQNIDTDNLNNTELVLMKKVPASVTDDGKPVYRDGEKFVITVSQFIKLINDPENAEILEKFEKSKGSAVLSEAEAEEFSEIDKLAKDIIDAKYPEWENTHRDIYDLDSYTLPERAEIYKAWKDKNRTRMYQQARELTPEEVYSQFGLKKIKAQLKNQKEGNSLMTAYDAVRRAIPEHDKAKLDNTLLDILNDTNTDTPITEIRQVIGYYGAKNQLNQLSKGKLLNIEKDLPEDSQTEFNNQLAELIKTKYLDITTGLPKVVQKASEARDDINKLLSNFIKDTNQSIWNRKIGNIKEVGVIVTDILNAIKEIKQINSNKADTIKTELIGAKNNWKKQQILGDALVTKLTEFLQYTNKVKQDELQKQSEIASINAKYTDPGQASIRNQEIDKIKNRAAVKSDQDIAHDAWLDMVKSITNPKSKAQDPTYYTAITNKISRLVKTDPQAAQGYYNEFKKLLTTLEAKNATKEEATLELVSFLDMMKDETAGYSTLSKAIDGAIINNGEL